MSTPMGATMTMPVSSIFGRNTLPVLTTDSMNLLRQQMDENNHEMVNLLTQQIDTVLNTLFLLKR